MYTTHITFTDGSTHKEDPISSEKIESTIKRLLFGPASRFGIIKSFMIVDSSDSVIFEAVDGKITHPRQPNPNTKGE